MWGSSVQQTTTATTDDRRHITTDDHREAVISLYLCRFKSRQHTAATLACSADGKPLPIVVSEGGRCRTFAVSGGLADASWFFSGWQQ